MAARSGRAFAFSGVRARASFRFVSACSKSPRSWQAPASSRQWRSPASRLPRIAWRNSGTESAGFARQVPIPPERAQASASASALGRVKVNRRLQLRPCLGVAPLPQSRRYANRGPRGFHRVFQGALMVVGPEMAAIPPRIAAGTHERHHGNGCPLRAGSPPEPAPPVHRRGARRANAAGSPLTRAARCGAPKTAAVWLGQELRKIHVGSGRRGLRSVGVDVALVPRPCTAMPTPLTPMKAQKLHHVFGQHPTRLINGSHC